MISNYYNLKFDLGFKKIDFHNVYNILPSLNERDQIINSKRLLTNDNLPIILFTHQLHDPLFFKNKKIIFILRSMYDTIVSFYFHNSNHHSRYNKDIKSFIRDENLGVNRFVNYLNSWSKYLSQKECLITSYESLHSDPEKVFLKVLNYLNLHLDEQIARKAIENSSFTNMKKVEITKGIINHEYDRKNNNNLRVREGKVGNYKELLDMNDLSFINKKLKKDLNSYSIEIISKYHVSIDGL